MQSLELEWFLPNASTLWMKCIAYLEPYILQPSFHWGHVSVDRLCLQVVPDQAEGLASFVLFFEEPIMFVFDLSLWGSPTSSGKCLIHFFCIRRRFVLFISGHPEFLAFHRFECQFFAKMSAVSCELPVLPTSLLGMGSSLCFFCCFLSLWRVFCQTGSGWCTLCCWWSRRRFRQFPLSRARSYLLVPSG